MMTVIRSMGGRLGEANCSSAFLALDDAMDGHDQLVVAAMLPSLEELADDLLKEHDDLTEAEALEAGSEIRALMLDTLEEVFATMGRSRRMSDVEGDTGAFWERQEGEPHTAYMAFCEYRDAGLTRSLRRAAAIFYAENSDDHRDQGETAGSPEIGTSGQVARFKAWSRRWMWRARVEAFDVEQARERSAEYAKRRIEAREQLYMTGRLQLDAAMLKANEMRNNAAGATRIGCFRA